MRESVPTPAESRYATLSLTPSTSRNCNVSAPGTTREVQCSPPSVVRAKVPPTPLAQTTFALTGLTAWSRLSVPLCCGVSVGLKAAGRRAAALALSAPTPEIDSSPEQASADATRAKDGSKRFLRIFMKFPWNGTRRLLRRGRRVRQGDRTLFSGRGIGERIARRRPDLHASTVGGGGRGEQILEMAHLRAVPERGAVELTRLQDRRIELGAFGRVDLVRLAVAVEEREQAARVDRERMRGDPARVEHRDGSIADGVVHAGAPTGEYAEHDRDLRKRLHLCISFASGNRPSRFPTARRPSSFPGE